MPTPARLTMTPLEDRVTPAAADLDLSFGQGGTATLAGPVELAPYTQLADLELLPDGRSILLSTSKNYDYLVARANVDGTLDTSFGQAGMATVDFANSTDLAHDAAVQSDGKVVVVGSAFLGLLQPGNRNNIAFGVVRLTDSGVLDTTFGVAGRTTVTGIGGAAAIAQAVAIQPDGAIVVAGIESDSVTQATTNLVVRLLPDGTRDPSFGTDGQIRFSLGSNSRVTGVAIQPDGRIVVAGTVGLTEAIGGDFAVARLTAAGQLDSTFDNDGLATYDLGGIDRAEAVVALADGRILISGSSQAGSAIVSQVIRLSPNGSLDATFGTAGKAAVDFGRQVAPVGAAVQPNGRLVFVGGPPTGVPDNLSDTSDALSVVRLDADGQPDQTFGTSGQLTVPTKSSAKYRDVAVQADGRLLFGGVSMDGFVAARLLGDDPAPPAGSVFVGGRPDGSAQLYTPTITGFIPRDPLTFYPGFTGTARVATADVTGDGVPDFVAGPGPGGGPNVVVISGATGLKVADFNAFETTFTGGVFVAAADLNGDGFAEVVVTPDQGGGPVVAIYDGSKLAAGLNDAAAISRFFGIDDQNFRGGARPAFGDVNGDGVPDLIVAAGFGGGPRVAIYDGARTADPGQWVFVRGTGLRGLVSIFAPPKLTSDFFVFEDTLRNGVFVAGGDLNADGSAELVVGGGPGGGPRVLALDGKSLLAGTQTPVANFFAGDSASRGGVHVAVRPAADGSPQLVTGSGEGEAAAVRVYTPAAGYATPAETFTPFGGAVLAEGVFVG